MNKKYCDCGNPQSYPIPHTHSIGKIKKGDKVFVYKSLPFGRSGIRKVWSVAEGHSIYVELTKKDSAYQNKMPHFSDTWQVMYGHFKPV